MGPKSPQISIPHSMIQSKAGKVTGFIMKDEIQKENCEGMAKPITTTNESSQFNSEFVLVGTACPT